MNVILTDINKIKISQVENISNGCNLTSLIIIRIRKIHP